MDENPYQSPGSYQSGPPGPPYAVVVLNDDLHTFAYVIETFIQVFGYAPDTCYRLATAIHTQGRAIVWSGPIEDAQQKRDQILWAGADLYASLKVEFPLKAVIEPLVAADAEVTVDAVKSVKVQRPATHTFCRVLWWGGSALILASWVDAVTPTVGWIGFAVAGVGWLLSRTIQPQPIGQTFDQLEPPPYDRT